jgi:myo-inositol-1(or 4)-monophosphatase
MSTLTHSIPFVRGASTVNSIMKVIYQASTILVRDFGELENLQTTQKNLTPFQERAERVTAKILSRELEKLFPNSSIVTSLPKSPNDLVGDTFLITGIDGVGNFMRANPHFSIGIEYFKEKTPIIAMVYNPILDELCWAEKGRGAFMNRRRLRMSQRDQFQESLLAWDGQRQLPICRSFRVTGSPLLDLTSIASARYDGGVFHNVSPEFYIFAEVLIQEAGGLMLPEVCSLSTWDSLEQFWILPPSLMKRLQA